MGRREGSDKQQLINTFTLEKKKLQVFNTKLQGGYQNTPDKDKIKVKLDKIAKDKELVKQIHKLRTNVEEGKKTINKITEEKTKLVLKQSNSDTCSFYG